MKEVNDVPVVEVLYVIENFLISSFPCNTRKVNTGFIWQWILTILTKSDGGYFSRFYQSMIKSCTN